MTDLKRKISEILVRWNMSTRQVAINEIVALLKETSEGEKKCDYPVCAVNGTCQYEESADLKEQKVKVVDEDNWTVMEGDFNYWEKNIRKDEREKVLGELRENIEELRSLHEGDR